MSDGFTAWAHLEAMGHRSHWGLVSEKQIAGASFLQIDCFKIGSDELTGTFLYPPASIYCLTPCSEERARLMCTPYSERPGDMKQAELPRPWDSLDVDVIDDEDEYAEL